LVAHPWVHLSGAAMEAATCSHLEVHKPAPGGRSTHSNIPTMSFCQRFWDSSLHSIFSMHTNFSLFLAWVSSAFSVHVVLNTVTVFRLSSIRHLKNNLDFPIFLLLQRWKNSFLSCSAHFTIRGQEGRQSRGVWGVKDRFISDGIHPNSVYKFRLHCE